MDNEKCRFCGKKLNNKFIDLGFSPLSNEYLNKSDLNVGQFYYPLVVNVCSNCFLTQASVYQKPDKIFGNYQYFSSYSKSWLEHCKKYVDMIIQRLNLTSKSNVLEIACNDGYLLQYFIPYGINVFGVDPAQNVVIDAKKKGINVFCDFFSNNFAKKLMNDGKKFDLIIGDNVLAHVPDINDFVSGLPLVLSENGTTTMEFPHILNLIKYFQFDTIYHEHFSYLSLHTVIKIFEKNKLKIYDVEKLDTHGGSIRIYATHDDNDKFIISENVNALLDEESEFGLYNEAVYKTFGQKVFNIKLNALKLLTQLKSEGKSIAAFGAAAKGNTFLNYCGIKNDIIDFVIDSNPNKVGLFLPGSLIPIVSPDILEQKRPDYLIILPWNLKNEIVQYVSENYNWNGKFITFIPDINVFD